MEHSCGAVLFLRSSEGIRYLIVTQSSGIHGFPKGHVEPGETEHETAAREILEETGIQVSRFIEGYRMEELYDVVKKPGVQKVVTYFLAEFSDQPIIRQETELRGAELMDYDTALAALERPERKEMLMRANALLLSL